MFTEQEIKAAHAQVKSGADYPRYVQALKSLGVLHYDYLVTTGQNIYYGKNGHTVTTGLGNGNRHIAAQSSAATLKHTIEIHQQGQTDFPTFCQQAAEAGVEKWVSDLDRMVVIYKDAEGRVMLEEPIPLSY